MTENEAVERIKSGICNEIGTAKYCHDNCMHGTEYCAYSMAIQALEEIQQYRALGTVEELKTFKDGFAVDFANMGYEKGLRDGYSKAKAYYKEQMKGGASSGEKV